MQLEARANVITLGAILVTAGISWGVMSRGLAEVQSDVTTQRTAAEISESRIRETLAGHEARIRTIEQSSARQDERLLLILDSVRKIEAKLENRSER